MSTQQHILMTRLNTRTFIIYFLAVSVALPIGFISLAKVLLLLCALTVITQKWIGRASSPPFLTGTGLTTPLVLLIIVIFSVSGLWSSGSTDDVLSTITKYGKLLLIPALLGLIRTRREALIALTCFIAGQVFLLTSTWLIFISVPIPWANSAVPAMTYAVFSSYLDQSIMTAVLAALCWHLRSYAPVRYQTLVSAVVSALALVCVFFIFQGRSGHVIAIALLTLTIFWWMPKKLHILALALPFVIGALLFTTSDKVRNGLAEITSSTAAFQQTGDISSPSSIRLNFWHRAAQSITERPWRGHGAGSWNQQFNQLEAQYAPQTFIASTGNPHQEYLLWGVQLGLPGILLLGALLLALYLDSQQLEAPARRALQSVLVALALACLFNSTLYDALIGDFFCVALALMLALRTPASPASPATAPSRL